MINDLRISIIFSNFAAIMAWRRLMCSLSVKKGKDMKIGGKIIVVLSTLVLVGLVVFVYVKFFFVYSQGVNEGDINYFQNEGFIFKTYEGKLFFLSW